jgi:hypothetical protein
MPHAAATISSRVGKAIVSSRTDKGYSRIPIGNPRAWSTGRYSRVPPIRGRSRRLKTSAAAASAAACQPVSQRNSSANSPDPMWIHWRACSE